MIKEVEWENSTLYVLFKTDEAYAYYKVPKGIYDRMIIAHKTGTSVGSFFDTFVKKAGYEYEKIDWKSRRLISNSKEPVNPMLFEVYKQAIFDLEKKGFANREMDEQGNERIVFTGEFAGEQTKMFKGTVLSKLDEDMLENFDETFPGQKRDYIRRKAVEHAVSTADQIILDASDGSEEETNYLTSQLALKFMEKADFVMAHALRKKELMESTNK